MYQAVLFKKVLIIDNKLFSVLLYVYITLLLKKSHKFINNFFTHDLSNKNVK